MAEPLLVTLLPSEKEAVMEAVEGEGGFQDLFRELQDQLDGDVLTIYPSQVGRIERCATEYGQGGFQDRLQLVLAAIQRAARA